MSKKTRELRLDVADDLHRWLKRKATSSTSSIAVVVRQLIIAAKAQEEGGK